jgi:NAD(P)H-nitrite reductase large subunit
VVQIVIYHDRVIGAILIGETDLDETIENLILNATDVGNIKDDLLNPTVDIEDYFD